jgi:ribosomal protein S26
MANLTLDSIKEPHQKNKNHIQRVKCDKCGRDLTYRSKSSHLKKNRCKVNTLTEDPTSDLEDNAITEQVNMFFEE